MLILIGKPLEYIMKLAGLWSYDFYVIGPLSMISPLITLLPFQFWHAMQLRKNLPDLMDNLSDIFTESLILIKFIILWKNKSHIYKILEEISVEWSQSQLPKDWIRLARYGRTFCAIDLGVYAAASFLYYPDFILQYLNKAVEDRQCLLRAVFPFNYRQSPIFEIINLTQFIQGWMMIISDSMSKGLFVALIFHVSAHISLLNEYIEEYSNYCIGYGNKNYRLNLVIKQHLKVLNLVKRIDAIYSYVSLFQIAFSNIIICVTGFVLITAVEFADVLLLVKFSMFIAAMLIQASCFCFAGQYLRNKGESVVTAIYNCLWYNAESKDIKAIMFILANAQKSLTLTGGKMLELSTDSFTMIVKTSASYLSVLRAVYV